MPDTPSPTDPRSRLFDLRDVLAFAGLVLMGVGAALVYVPAGLILVGLLVFMLARPWAS